MNNDIRPIDENAPLAGALERPMQKPLTHKEEEEILNSGVRVWIEERGRYEEPEGVNSGYLMTEGYGTKWRCWASEPTGEEREAAAWGELINGRTPEEIKIGCKVCGESFNCGAGCPYRDVERGCMKQMSNDIIALIEHLEAERDAALAKAPKWISVEEYLPENEECVFVTAKHDGYFGNPWRTVMTAFHTDGKTIVGESGYNWSEGSVEMEYDEEADDFIVPEGWWEDVQCGDEFSKVEYKVTHWMPLPEPPEEDAHG